MWAIFVDECFKYLIRLKSSKLKGFDSFFNMGLFLGRLVTCMFYLIISCVLLIYSF